MLSSATMALALLFKLDISSSALFKMIAVTRELGRAP
jgi:hypothetical protein